MTKNNFVLVYGTLKKGFSNHGVMVRAGGQFVGKAVTLLPEWYLEDLGHFPGAVPGKFNLSGEVFRVSQDGIENHLDSLEGYPYFYDRKLVDVILVSGGVKLYNVWVYYLAEARESTHEVSVEKMSQLLDRNGVVSWDNNGVSVTFS